MGDTRAAARVFELGNAAGGENGLVDWAELALIPQALVPPVAVQAGDAASALAAVRALAQNVATGASTGLVGAERAQIDERLARMTDFLSAQAASAQPVNGTRLGAVCVALSQIGQVSAKEAVTPPDGGLRTRVGADRLDEYFSVSFGDAYTAALKASVRQASLELPSWCGIFALWALKSAGVACKSWHLGSGIAAILKPTTAPVAGDVAFLNGAGMHMCLVLETTPDELVSIDGNTDADGGPTGGEIGVKRRPISRVQAFYSQSDPVV
ncbi:MAG TPA: hypothetical protein VMI54_21740 [Polyangiaceae bacterium]|nr:hypothetical protein [Polyangiaceae bacterium]